MSEANQILFYAGLKNLDNVYYLAFLFMRNLALNSFSDANGAGIGLPNRSDVIKEMFEQPVAKYNTKNFTLTDEEWITQKEQWKQANAKDLEEIEKKSLERYGNSDICRCPSDVLSTIKEGGLSVIHVDLDKLCQYCKDTYEHFRNTNGTPSFVDETTGFAIYFRDNRVFVNKFITIEQLTKTMTRFGQDLSANIGTMFNADLTQK